jgi:alkylhydroperoxidase/carboxymuconolactone decarboxylase family protein YurZ
LLNKLKNEKKVLPPSLLSSLNFLQRLARKLALLKYISSIFLLSLGSCATLFILDRFIETPIWLRSFLTGSTFLIVLYFGYQLFLQVYILPRSQEWLARKVKKAFGGPGDRFLGIIELTNAGKEEEEGKYSQALFLAAQEKVDQEISNLPLNQTFNRKTIYQRTLSLFVLSVLATLSFFSFPELTYNSFKRWVMPWKNISRATLTKFSNLPREWVLPRGEVTQFAIRLDENSKFKPQHAFIKDDHELSIEADEGDGIYEFVIPGLFNTHIAQLNAGDFKRELILRPVDRPQIRSLEVKAFYPSYLGIEPDIVVPINNTYSYPLGTKLQIEGNASRKLSSMNAILANDPLDSAINKSFFSTQVPALESRESLSLELIDCFNLSPRNPEKLSLNPIEDKAPLVNFPEAPSEATIIINETVPIRLSASDDYGLARFQLCMQFPDRKEKNATHVLWDQEEVGQIIKNEFTLPFDPSFFNLEDGDRIELFGRAWDRMPGRVPTVSKKIVLRVIGLEAHAEQLREDIENIMARTSEIAREQENILMETSSLEQELRYSEKELNTIAELQQENAKNLKNAAEDGLSILDEAVRNPMFETESLEKFAQTLNKMQTVASSPMRDASMQIKQAKISKSLSGAIMNEQSALEQLEEILAEGASQLDRLEALTLSQRLRKFEKTEIKLGKDLLSILPQSIGQIASDLKSHVKEKKLLLEEIQRNTHIQVKNVRGEISRYHERTGKPAYGKVSELMKSENPEGKILNVSYQIQQNITFEALDGIEILSKKFSTWAGILEDGDPSSGEGQGQGQKNSKSKDFTQSIIALIKIREEESNIISKTKVLQNENFRARRENWTSLLQTQQEKLMIDLTDTQIEVATEALNPIFDDAHMSMSTSAIDLKNGKYSIQTINAQSDARNQVSDLINLLIESTDSGKSKENELGEEISSMEFLLLQAKQEGGKKPGKMLTGSTGGGSQQGGGTEKEARSAQGKAFENSRSRKKNKKNRWLIPVRTCGI